jgi:Zn-dependent protease with chaperone function
MVLVLVIHFQFWQPIIHSDFALPGAWLFHALFRLDLPLAELGAAAAACIGIYIEFGRSRLNLSQAFPNLTFYEPTRDLVQTVERLAKSAEIECPDVSLVDSGSPSAFTVRSRGKYTIAVSIGLLESFESSEVEACIAHEICHIKNRDFALRTIVTIVRVALFARVLSYFVESAFYRTRELLADRTAALLVGGPEALVSALTKLQKANTAGEDLTGNMICLFDGKKTVFELLSKHPTLSTRIRLLKELGSASK